MRGDNFMKVKHLDHRIRSVLSIANLSECVRRKVGCVFVDPETNTILSEGYNGWLRGQKGSSCAKKCVREEIISGTKLEQGCVHAEMNAIVNACANGTNLSGSYVFVTTEPCLICAKLLIQLRVSKVFCISAYKTQEGVQLLEECGIDVEYIQLSPPNPNLKIEQSPFGVNHDRTNKTVFKEGHSVFK